MGNSIFFTSIFEQVIGSTISWSRHEGSQYVPGINECLDDLGSTAKNRYKFFHIDLFNIDQIKNDYHPIYSKSNIEFRIKNVLDDLTPEFVSKLKIVMIDIDHFGKIESLIINKLYKMGFSGIIILDDIHHPQPKEKLLMENLWRNINLKKYDVTKYGHFSGTGIVIMNSNIDFELL